MEIDSLGDWLRDSSKALLLEDPDFQFTRKVYRGFRDTVGRTVNISTSEMFKKLDLIFPSHLNRSFPKKFGDI